MNEYDVKVYFEKNKIYTNLDILVQHDYNSTKLNFTFDKEGRVLFKLKAPNGDNILNTQVVNNEVILEPGVLSQVGDYEAEISLYGNDSKLTNYQTLNFYVRDVLINTDEIIEPSHEKEILDQLINDVNTLDSTVNTNEATRQSNEQTRVSNENTRISNETTRQANETEREEYIDQLKQDVEDGKFDGKDGEDGYTPQKGIDYYTEEEKEEMIDYIVNDANSEFNRNVNEKTIAFNTNATNKTDNFNSNASSKLDIYNSNHTSKMNAYNQNATDKTTAFDTNATNKTTAYDNNASSKLTAYNDNATEKLSAYNTNHTEKLTAYNDNASDKLDEYNDNAEEKIDEFNENKEELQRAIDYYKSTLNALPKVEGEGTSLTLDDTAEAPMKMSLAPSELEQASTTGKNLYSGGNKTFTQSITFDIEPIPAGTYVLSGNIVSSDTDQTISLMAFFKDNTQVGFKNSPRGNINTTITLNDIANKVTLYASNGAVTSEGDTATFSNIMISTEGGDYEPYTGGNPSPNPDYPQDIHTISGDNEIKVGNKNLANIDSIEIGKAWNDGYNSLRATIVGIPIKKNANYTLVSSWTNSNITNIRAAFYNDYNFVITPTTFPYQNTAYNYVSIEILANTNFTRDMLNNVKILFCEDDATINDYVPHQEQSLPLNLPVENLLPTNVNDWEQGNINADGNVQATNSIRTKDYYPIKNNVDYHLTVQNTSYCFRNIRFYDSNKSYIYDYWSYDYTIDGSTNKTINIPSTIAPNVAYMRVVLRNSNGTTITANEVEIIKPQIEQGTKANSYTPYGTPALEYCKIPNTDYEDEFVIPSGKNLASGSSKNSYVNSSGVIILNSTQNYLGVNEKIKILPNQKYTMTFFDYLTEGTLNVAFFKEDETLISREQFLNTRTFTTPENCYYVFPYLYSSSTIFTKINGKMQLEKNATATAYEPYNDGKWYLKKNVGKVVLNGSEDWTKFDVAQGTLFRNITKIINDIDDNSYTPYSNYYKCIPFSQKDNRTNFNLYIGSIDYTLDIMDDRFATVSDFKTWLSTNNVIVYYVLATPTYTLLNDTLQSQLTEIYKWVKAYQDQTNISQVNNDLPFVIKASAIYDLSKLMTRVEVLESEV